LLEKVWLTYGKGLPGRFPPGHAKEAACREAVTDIRPALFAPVKFNETRVCNCERQCAWNGPDTHICTIDMHTLMIDESSLRRDWHTWGERSDNELNRT
jgi:hypothetical protein